MGCGVFSVTSGWDGGEEAVSVGGGSVRTSGSGGSTPLRGWKTPVSLRADGGGMWPLGGAAAPPTAFAITAAWGPSTPEAAAAFPTLKSAESAPPPPPLVVVVAGEEERGAVDWL